MCHQWKQCVQVLSLQYYESHISEAACSNKPGFQVEARG